MQDESPWKVCFVFHRKAHMAGVVTAEQSLELQLVLISLLKMVRDSFISN